MVRCQRVLSVNNVSCCLFEDYNPNLSLFWYAGVPVLTSPYPKTQTALEIRLLLKIWWGDGWWGREAWVHEKCLLAKPTQVVGYL